MFFASSDRDTQENHHYNPNEKTTLPLPKKTHKPPHPPIKLAKVEISLLTRKISSAHRQLVPIHNTT